MRRLYRILKHRLWDETDAQRVLPLAALDRLQQRVAVSEALHSGEIRICVEASLPMSYLWRDAPARERAVAMFGKLRVWDTELNNGVLIYLLLAEHRIELVADRALNRHTDPAKWQSLMESMSEAFRKRDYESGLAKAIDGISALLTQHFPSTPGMVRANELPDQPELI